MAAYVISEVEGRDPELLAAYRELAARSIARHGGRYLVRGGTVELVEGEPAPKMIVIVEFDDMAGLRAWYESPDYAEALAVRHRGALERRLLFVEGVPSDGA